MFSHNAAAPTSGMTLLPDGNYEVKILKVEQKLTRKDRYPMVNITCEVINNVAYNGKKIFHNVTFMPKDKKGAGMSTHFLKCINQPWEGEIDVDPDAWVGEVFKATVSSREYVNDKGTKQTVNDIKDVEGTTPF